MNNAMNANATALSASEFRAACVALECALDSYSSARKNERDAAWRRAERAGEFLRLVQKTRAGASAREWAQMLKNRYMLTKANRIAAEMFA